MVARYIAVYRVCYSTAVYGVFRRRMLGCGSCTGMMWLKFKFTLLYWVAFCWALLQNEFTVIIVYLSIELFEGVR